MKDHGEFVTLGSGEEVYVPNIRIHKNTVRFRAHLFIFHPCRGVSGSVAVENIQGEIIGWLAVEDLPGGPYETVQAWMKAVNWCGQENP